MGCEKPSSSQTTHVNRRLMSRPTKEGDRRHCKKEERRPCPQPPWSVLDRPRPSPTGLFPCHCAHPGFRLWVSASVRPLTSTFSSGTWRRNLWCLGSVAAPNRMDEGKRRAEGRGRGTSQGCVCVCVCVSTHYFYRIDKNVLCNVSTECGTGRK